MALNRRTRFRQRPLRERWEFEWLPVLIEGDPHLGEVVKVTPQAITTGRPFEGLRFRRCHGIRLICPVLTTAGMATQSSNSERACHQNFARLDEFVFLHARDGRYRGDLVGPGPTS